MSEPLERAEETCKKLGGLLGPAIPPGWGFVLILMNYNQTTPKGRLTYISSCDRETIPTALREMADLLEGGKGEV